MCIFLMYGVSRKCCWLIKFSIEVMVQHLLRLLLTPNKSSTDLISQLNLKKKNKNYFHAIQTTLRENKLFLAELPDFVFLVAKFILSSPAVS